MKPQDLKCFQQVADVIGHEYAEYELQRVIDDVALVDASAETVIDVVWWDKSTQGCDFWNHIDRGRNPYENGRPKPNLEPNSGGDQAEDNPRDLKFDGDKTRMELLPFDALEEVAKVLTFGAKKYEANSWQTLANAEQRYKGALLRHYAAMDQGEQLDDESGLLHAAHMACDALFLLHFEIERLKNLEE